MLPPESETRTKCITILQREGGWAAEGGTEGSALHGRFRGSFHGYFRSLRVSAAVTEKSVAFTNIPFFRGPRFIVPAAGAGSRGPREETIPFWSTYDSRRKKKKRKKKKTSPSRPGVTLVGYVGRGNTFDVHRGAGLGELTLLSLRPVDDEGQVWLDSAEDPAIVTRRSAVPLAQDANNDVTMAAVSTLQKQRPL